MKIGKIIILSLVICMLFLVSSNVFAAIPDGMSEEFKSILNEEGQFVVTDTMNNDNKSWLLSDAIMRYNTDKYNFGAIYTENSDIVTILRHDNETGNELERYDIEIVYQEKFSEDFKKITDNGEIVITTSNLMGKERAVNNYCNESNPSDKLHFWVTDFNEKESVCTIKLYKQLNPEDANTTFVEQHKVKIKYEEKFSDRFNKVLKDGKIVVQASRENKRENLLYSYFSFISIWDSTNQDLGRVSISDMNEDCTKCTLQMYESYEEGNTIHSKLIEEHVVDIEYIKEMSDYYKKQLNKDGKFVVNSIKPQTEEEFVGLFEVMFYNKGIYADFEFVSKDFSSCEITIINDKGIPETHKVGIEYKYDEKVKEIADKMTSSIKKEEGKPHYFYVKDLELINYWLNSGDESEKMGASNFDNYSGELKELTNHKNFNLSIDHRMGADEEFFTMRGGIGLLQYKDTTYYINYMLAVLGNHIIYVPNETESTREALAQAVQKRVDEYVGENKVKITAGEGTVLDFYKNNSERMEKELQNKIDAENSKEKPDINLINEYKGLIEWYRDYYVEEYVKESYNDPKGEHYFLQSAEGGFWFTATVNGEDYEFIVIKDSSKMITPKYKTSDVKTNVEISSTSTEIPLDTVVEAEKVTEGSEYEKIVKVLEVEEHAIFDLNLFSNSLNKHVKKLENGNFEVRIPIPENLKNKKLAVYFVDDNNNIEEYEVKIEGEYAVFITKHFSTYTLAEENEKINDENVDKENNNTITEEDNITNNNENLDNKEDKENNIKNPATGDNILLFVGMLTVSIVGIIITLNVKKKYNK